MGHTIDDSIYVDAHCELVEQQSRCIVYEHHHKFQCPKRDQMPPQRIIPHQINDRKHSSMFSTLVFIILLLDLTHTLQRQAMILYTVPFGNAHEGRVSVLSSMVRYQFDRRVLHHKHEPQDGDDDRQDKDKQNHPSPVVNEVEGYRVDQRAHCEGKTDQIVKSTPMLLRKELSHKCENRTVRNIEARPIEEDPNDSCSL